MTGTRKAFHYLHCNSKGFDVMEKEQILKLYKEFLQKNPLIAYIRTICREYDELKMLRNCRKITHAS